MPRLSFQPLGDSWTLVLVLLAATIACSVYLSLQRSARAAKFDWKRKFELGLRLALIALLAALFARPSLVVTEKEELPASIAILVDDSESMSIRDEADEASRYEALQKLFTDASTPFAALCEKFDVHAYAFSDVLTELDIADGAIAFPQDAQGRETKLGDALTETLRTTAGKRLLCAIVLSDGSQRVKSAEDAISTQDAALRLRDAELPVYATAFGSDNVAAVTRDVAVSDLRANDQVFLGNELTVSGQVRLLGCAGIEVPLTLSLETPEGEMQIVAETTLKTESNDATLPYQFTCAPSAPGQWKLDVAAPTLEHELLDANNQLSAFVEAIDRGIDVLYVEGTRRYEQNFLRLALDASSDVRVRYWRPSTASLIAKSPNKTEAEMIAQYAASRKSLEKTFFSEGKFATYILGDVDVTAFQPNELKALLKMVEEGAGLVVLVGERSLGAGGYADSPLAKAFPVQTSDADRIELNTDLSSIDSQLPLEERLRVASEYRVELAGGATKNDFVTRLSLDPKKNAELWASMPALNSLYRLGKLKPNAQTLLTARPVDKQGKIVEKSKPAPLLVAHQYGLGRVVVLATDSTWRWRMRGKETEHSKFWRQLVLWSAKFDDLLEGELAAELERTRFDVDEDVDLRVVYRPKPGEDLSGAKVAASIVAPDGTREELQLVEENGLWRGQGHKTRVPGDYLVEARLLSASGDVQQTAQARFLVYERNLELERPQADPAALASIAEIAQGRYVERDEFPALLEELLQRRDTIADYREVDRSLCSTWTFFALFVALMTLDWILRKRWGMV